MVKLSSLLIGVVVVSMVALSAGQFMYDQSEQYQVTDIDMGFNNTFDHLDSMTNTTENLRQKIQTSELISVEGFSALFNGAFAILRLTMSALLLPITIMSDAASALNMPPWIVAGVTSIIVILAVFAVANIVFGRGRA